MAKKVEIERKFLIKRPDLKELNKQFHVIKYEIEQVYLVAEKGERRIRKSVGNRSTQYTYTEKLPKGNGGLKRDEDERPITPVEYEALLEEADTDLKPIYKTRYRFYYAQKWLELDVYSFSEDLAILEIELKSEIESISIPHTIQVKCDVTNDSRYKNHNLAKVQTLEF